jgi:hypothetical protein
MIVSKGTQEVGRKVRITLDLSEQAYTRLEKLEAIVDADSKAQLIRQAMQVFEYLVHRTAEGCSFKVVDRSGRESEVVILSGRGPES